MQRQHAKALRKTKKRACSDGPPTSSEVTHVDWDGEVYLSERKLGHVF